MGSSSSRNPRPLIKEPWVQINWGGDRENDLQFIRNYKPRADNQQLRILLHGPVGAGKSSFVNSVCSLFQGRVCTSAMVNNDVGDSCTKKFSTYRFEKDDGQNFYPFVISDMIGLDNTSRRNRNIHVKDIKEAMKGRIKDGYTFNPECKILKEDRHFNNSPTQSETVHVLVCVIDATTATELNPEVVETIKDIRDEAANLGIPQVAIFTKIDKACPKTKQDVKDVYRSKLLRSKIKRFSKKVGIPVSCIFPVKNYTEEIKLTNDIDVLLLSTMRRIINIGDDFLNKRKD
ncbi:interferon-induced protein 44-like isoform X2 [Cyprinodon tularosa]|uniref:Interferon-induced protein 44-like n=1 Tax=Cyprinodon variegatus TaxID=28743 RepID=A0A3Q2FZG3_CYPVA|nr:PREDICTED: interferon-induced protein 44-like isoform X2 [Cyprinodon variegatus]XP_015228289.1 PREDICTED: interferon-induced protein 44-like isoform X2 [Cyprinodon variegatus]XP_038128551.1 interferon-induced protein 44-like isoform X2 [Cyprinodon tularosa]XP_038128552.1 interferon-induced protein 44-like isoform X2 [Cyprinodon tularosa]XP_038128553.1 interferon-induced protein 44-like isoform X2 [Cyprinodon tularosa]